MSVNVPKLVDALILERARVLYLLSLDGEFQGDLDTADILIHVEQARREIEVLLTGMRTPQILRTQPLRPKT